MGEAPLTVRLFVQTQTYDIACDPRQPAQWLLMQAKNIQRANIQRAAAAAAAANEQFAPPKQSPHDELEVLYNRTTRSVIDLSDTIGQTIAPMDVVDARTLLQTPDVTFNSAMFPWLRTTQRQSPSSKALQSTDGLFFQQLYAYTLIGNRTPVLASQRKERQHKDAFHALLESYVRGAFDADGSSNNSKEPIHTRRNSSSHSYNTQQSPHPPPRPAHRASAAYNHQQHQQHHASSSSDSDTAADALAPLRIPSSPYANASKYSNAASPTSPSLAVASSPSSSMDAIDNIFDIVFKQQSLGMKLGADESKQFAIVKECIGNSEAARYPEIQHGVVILAVNGQEVAGLTLARILYRLREAPRPVVVRFGRLATTGGGGRGERQPTGTWG